MAFQRSFWRRSRGALTGVVVCGLVGCTTPDPKSAPSASAASATEEPPTPAGPVTLEFGWPVPWEQRLVVEERSVEVHGSRRVRSPVERHQAVLRTVAVEGGVRVEVEGAAAPATLRLAPDGTLIDVESEDPAAAAAATELWNLLVGWWAGRELEVGAGLEADAAADGAGGMRGQVNLWLRGWDRCADRRAARWCARLELVIRADPQATAELARRFAADYLEALRASRSDLEDLELEVASVKAEVQYEVLAHPDTLRPVWATRRQWQRLSVALEGEPREFVAETVRETRWTFPLGPAGTPVLHSDQNLDSRPSAAP